MTISMNSFGVSLLWAALWVITLHASIAVAILTINPTNPVSGKPVNRSSYVAIASICWAVLIVFWFN